MTHVFVGSNILIRQIGKVLQVLHSGHLQEWLLFRT